MSFAQVLTLAQQMEMVGQQAYRRFADQATEPAIRELFVYLADEEAEHETFFGELRQRLQRGEMPGARLSPDQVAELGAIVKAVQDRDVPSVLNDTATSTSVEDLIDRAIEFEKAIMALFSKTRDCIGDVLGQQTLDAIIAEELEHVKTLEAKRPS